MTDPWHWLRRYTQARIAQGRAGCSLPSSALLDFQLAHAAARDAVLQDWDIGGFAEDTARRGLQVLRIDTAVASRTEYLLRPDKGRRLLPVGRQLLANYGSSGVDIAITISNGLSSTAVQRHGAALLDAILHVFRPAGWQLGPICLVANARVALADEIGELLKARLSVIILGERPGLSGADSLGVYLTYAPKIGKTDAERNCISNIRPPEGLSCALAAAKLHYLASEALRRGISGVTLKDDMSGAVECLE